MADKRMDNSVLITDPATPTRQATVNASNQLSISVDNTANINIQQIDGQVPTMDGSGNFQVVPTFHSNTWITETVDAINSVGSGIQAVSMIAQFDDVAPTTITENQFRNLRMSTKRSLYTQIRDAAGNERGANVNASNQLSVSVDAFTASNASTNVAQIAGATASTVATGVLKVGIADSAGTAFLSAANALNSTGGGIQAVQMVGQFDDVSPTAITENQFGNLRISANRNLYSTIRDAAGNERGANVNASNQLSVSVDNNPVLGAAASTVIGQVKVTDGTTVASVIAGTTALKTDLSSVAGTATVTAASGVQKVGIVGNANATVDSTVGAGTAPTNQIVVGSIYNSSAPAPTTGQAMAQQADEAGNLRTFNGIALKTLSGWTSATSVNATQNIFTNSGCPAVLVQLTQTSTITGGAITFEVSFDNSTWVTIPADAVMDPTSTTNATISLPYTLQASTNKYFLIANKGWQGLRIKLSTAITGTATVTPNYALLNYDPVEFMVAYSPTAANFNAQVVGNVASGASDSGNPVKIGMNTVAHGSNPSAVTAGQRVNWLANRAGIPWVIGGHPNIVSTEFHFTTSQTDVALVTVSSGTKIVVTRISAVNSNATTVNVGCRIGFAASTLSAASSSGITGIVLSHSGIAPGSGVVEGNGSGILGVGADGEDLRITCDAATTGSFRVIVSYYTIES